MHTGTTIFSQVMRHLPWHHFHRMVQHYGGDYTHTGHYRSSPPPILSRGEPRLGDNDCRIPGRCTESP